MVTKALGILIKNKLGDRGTPCVFLGYATSHAGNVYRMLNPTTGRVVLMRDVTWTNKLYKPLPNEANKLTIMNIEKQTTEFVNPEEEITFEGIDKPLFIPYENEAERTSDQLPKRASPELQMLKSFNNRGQLETEGLFAFSIMDEQIFVKPTKFEDAWNKVDEEMRNKWRESIKKEFDQMMKNNVWEKQPLQESPHGRKGIGT